MKKRDLIFLIILLTAVVLTSCSSTEYTTRTQMCTAVAPMK
jgi:hypothetical protein